MLASLCLQAAVALAVASAFVVTLPQNKHLVQHAVSVRLRYATQIVETGWHLDRIL